MYFTSELLVISLCWWRCREHRIPCVSGEHRAGRKSVGGLWYFSCQQNVWEENSIKVWQSCFVIFFDLPSNPAVFHKPGQTGTSLRRKWGHQCLVWKPQSTARLYLFPGRVCAFLFILGYRVDRLMWPVAKVLFELIHFCASAQPVKNIVFKNWLTDLAFEITDTISNFIHCKWTPLKISRYNNIP